jgi:drug/metabolite transporter (DMT)-like permease
VWRRRLLLTDSDVAADRPISGRDLTSLVLAAACWGIGTVVSKRALAEVPPLTLLAIQLAVSVGVLAVFLRGRRPMASTGSPPLLARLGLLNPGLAYALSLLGLVTISASLSVLLWALEPLLIVVLAGWLLNERITRRLALLTIIAVAGMVVVVYDPTSAGALGGVALTLAGIGCCAVYSTITRRWLPDAESTGDVVLAQQAYALAFALVLVVGLAVIGGDIAPRSPTAAGLASAIGSGLLYYAAAYWFYLAALKNLPASRAVLSFYLIPIFGVAASFVALGERLGPQQWVGAAIVIGTVVASARTPAAESTASSPERASLVGRL